ncbi:hypothetical protein NQ315_017287 [Exocentrus adspersus]|uniref:Uncharacterized protein n=1 Tax=Exocentrus adspersus TaxID=1586481 RepID=A0AAV8VJQ8_9CUCU|nr:hypothetical protein NQ315_017287 [Exocentrus adspersus]
MLIFTGNHISTLSSNIFGEDMDLSMLKIIDMSNNGITDIKVKHGADINCRDMLKMTPLHWAVQNGHLDIVAYLINNGAEVELQNKFNLTALQIAQQINRSDIEEYITNSLTNPAEATQNLVIQLAMDDVMECNSGSQGLEERIIDLGNESSNHESIVIPIEPDIMAKLEPVNSEVEDDSAQSGKCQ